MKKFGNDPGCVKTSSESFGRKIDSRSTTLAHDRYAVAELSFLLLRAVEGLRRFRTAKTLCGHRPTDEDAPESKVG